MKKGLLFGLLAGAAAVGAAAFFYKKKQEEFCDCDDDDIDAEFECDSCCCDECDDDEEFDNDESVIATDNVAANSNHGTHPVDTTTDDTDDSEIGH